MPNVLIFAGIIKGYAEQSFIRPQNVNKEHIKRKYGWCILLDTVNCLTQLIAGHNNVMDTVIQVFNMPSIYRKFQNLGPF
jgi:hypothetical protein